MIRATPVLAPSADLVPRLRRFVLFLLVLLSAPLGAQPPKPVPLNGIWKLRAGDSLAWASPRYDDRRWTDAPVPAEWETVLGAYDGFGWYRRTVVLDSALAEGPVGIRFATVGDAFEVYWNGVRIGKRGSFPPKFVEGLDPSLFIVPTSALGARPRGPHVVAVRVYNAYAYGGLMDGVAIGRYDILSEHRPSGDMIVGGLVSFFLAIGIYHLAFFIRRRAATENLYFAALCALVALYGATFSSAFIAVVLPYANPFRLATLALAAAGPFFLALIYRLFNLRFGRVEHAVFGWFSAAVIAALVLPLGPLARVEVWLDAADVLGLVVLIARISTRSFGAERPLPYARLLWVGTVVFAGTLIYDALGENGLATIAGVVPGVGYTFWLGFLSFVMTVGIATAGQWALAEINALTDPLTRLARRHVLEETLRREIERLRRAGGHLALVLIDLDHFKQVNDTWGHPAGDAVLAHVGGLLRYATRGLDLPARVGGEEMAVLLIDADEAGAATFAERLQEQIRKMETRVPGGVVRVTASMGVAVAREAADADALIAAADAALYRAKQQGRDRTAFATAGETAGDAAPARRRWTT